MARAKVGSPRNACGWHAAARVEPDPRDVHDLNICTHLALAMRTNIEIDERLMADAMLAAGTSTKKETVAEALELLVRLRRDQTAIRSLRSRIDWQGDLDSIRRG